MENKNVELAKLLGVKPFLYVKSLVSGCSLENPVPQDDYVLSNIEIGRLEILSEIYPDFTKPSNFVKLQCIKTTENGKVRLGGLLAAFFNTDNPINNFIEEVVRYLENLTYLDKLNINGEAKYVFIQKQAQATEWTY